MGTQTPHSTEAAAESQSAAKRVEEGNSMVNKAALINQIRYAERLCNRTARLYKRLQTFGTFATVIGGSATLSALSPHIPSVVSLIGSASFVVFGAALLAIRPNEKATANEADAKRYTTLRTMSGGMTTEELEVALNKTHETGAPEVEALRDVAYNDVCKEMGRPDSLIKLNFIQRAIAAVA